MIYAAERRLGDTNGQRSSGRRLFRVSGKVHRSAGCDRPAGASVTPQHRRPVRSRYFVISRQGTGEPGSSRQDSPCRLHLNLRRGTTAGSATARTLRQPRGMDPNGAGFYSPAVNLTGTASPPQPCSHHWPQLPFSLCPVPPQGPVWPARLRRRPAQSPLPVVALPSRSLANSAPPAPHGGHKVTRAARAQFGPGFARSRRAVIDPVSMHGCERAAGGA